MTVERCWAIIEAVLRENAHSVSQSLRKPITDTSLARLTKTVSAKLPRDFVRSLRVHDGMRNSYLGRVRFFDNYALLPASAIISEYRVMCQLQAEFQFPGNPCGGDPLVKNDAHWRPGWVPIMDDEGNKLVLDLDPGIGGRVGQVFDWSSHGGWELHLLAPSFGEWLSMIAEKLGKREFRLDEHGGICLCDEAWPRR